MTDYFMLECFAPGGEDVLDILEYPFIDGVDSWLLGARFDVAIPEPIELQWDGATRGVKKSYYNVTIPLMTRELVGALRSSGVDNIDEYAVRIRDATSDRVDESYVAVNVLGAVAAADRAQSTYQDPTGLGRADLDFDRLVLATDATHGLLLFRLAECVTGLVIHSSVRSALEARGGFGLSFIRPEEWIG